MRYWGILMSILSTRFLISFRRIGISSSPILIYMCAIQNMMLYIMCRYVNHHEHILCIMLKNVDMWILGDVIFVKSDFLFFIVNMTDKITLAESRHIFDNLLEGNVEPADKFFADAIQKHRYAAITTLFKWPIIIEKFPATVEKWFDTIVETMDTDLLISIFSPETSYLYRRMSQTPGTSNITIVTEKLLLCAPPTFIHTLIKMNFRPASVWNDRPETFLDIVLSTQKYEFLRVIKCSTGGDPGMNMVSQYIMPVNQPTFGKN